MENCDLKKKPRLASRGALEDIFIKKVWPEVRYILVALGDQDQDGQVDVMSIICCNQVRRGIKNSPGSFDLEVSHSFPAPSQSQSLPSSALPVCAGHRRAEGGEGDCPGTCSAKVSESL